MQFVCNVCGFSNRRPAEGFSREKPSCTTCGSNVRLRGLLQALSLELFGLNLTLPEFPRVKSLRGLGLSDAVFYADQLAAKFDYRNTFFHREPFFDIRQIEDADCGRYDFIISSEVFEHVPPPAETAFANAFRLLREGGILAFTVPFSLEATTAEHFPNLHEFGLAHVGDRTVLVNRTRAGEFQVFENLAFHVSFGGPSLEIREFSECSLKAVLTGAGFSEVRVYSEDYPPYGIVRSESWSLPMVARKGNFALSREATRDILEHWSELKQKFDSEMRQLRRSYWFRLGRKMGWF